MIPFRTVPALASALAIGLLICVAPGCRNANFNPSSSDPWAEAPASTAEETPATAPLPVPRPLPIGRHLTPSLRPRWSELAALIRRMAPVQAVRPRSTAFVAPSTTLPSDQAVQAQSEDFARRLRAVGCPADIKSWWALSAIPRRAELHLLSPVAWSVPLGSNLPGPSQDERIAARALIPFSPDGSVQGRLVALRDPADLQPSSAAQARALQGAIGLVSASADAYGALLRDASNAGLSALLFESQAHAPIHPLAGLDPDAHPGDPASPGTPASQSSTRPSFDDLTALPTSRGLVLAREEARELRRILADAGSTPPIARLQTASDWLDRALPVVVGRIQGTLLPHQWIVVCVPLSPAHTTAEEDLIDALALLQAARSEGLHPLRTLLILGVPGADGGATAATEWLEAQTPADRQRIAAWLTLDALADSSKLVWHTDPTYANAIRNALAPAPMPRPSTQPPERSAPSPQPELTPSSPNPIADPSTDLLSRLHLTFDLPPHCAGLFAARGEAIPHIHITAHPLIHPTISPRSARIQELALVLARLGQEALPSHDLHPLLAALAPPPPTNSSTTPPASTPSPATPSSSSPPSSASAPDRTTQTSPAEDPELSAWRQEHDAATALAAELETLWSAWCAEDPDLQDFNNQGAALIHWFRPTAPPLNPRRPWERHALPPSALPPYASTTARALLARLTARLKALTYETRNHLNRVR